MIHKPDVSVVTHSRDVNKYYFESCIDSLLNQTFTKFEIIIVLEPLDKDNSKNLEYIKNKYKDDRILFLSLKEKMYFADYLNYGIKNARGKYIARMDIDDICLKDRLKMQFDFMEKKHNCIVCGSYMKTFGDKKKHLKTQKQDSLNRFGSILFAAAPILNSTAFIRKEAFDSLGYSKGYKAEDYKLWIDLALKTDMEFCNIPKVLVKYRVHKNQRSIINKEYIAKEIINNCIYYLESLNLDISNDDILFHRKILDGTIKLNFRTKKKIEKHLQNLKMKIEDKFIIEIDKSFYSYVWYSIFHHFNKFSFVGLLSYWMSPYFISKIIYSK